MEKQYLKRKEDTPVIRDNLKRLALRVSDFFWKHDPLRRELSELLRDTNARVRDTQDRAYDLVSDLRDTMIRTHDTQDRAYDLVSDLRDTMIRTHDTQDRAYDILWQIKTQNHQREMMFWQLYKRSDEELEDSQMRFFRALPAGGGIF